MHKFETGEHASWSGLVPVDDTALAVTDTGGSGIPVLYLNGQFATQGYWRRVIAELGGEWRHITFDQREGREQPRRDPAQGVPGRRRGGPRGRRTVRARPEASQSPG